VKNSIFWNNTGSASFTNANVSYSLAPDRPGGTGNITTDPRFVDADGADNVIGTPDDNLHLRAGSPAIDAGDNSVLPSDTNDVDGNPRFVDDPTTPDTGNGTSPLVDMGAYEYQLDQPLSAPTNLTVTLALRAHITLSWKDNSDNERGFTIERSAGGVGGWVEIGHVATNVTTYTDRLLPCHTTYVYRVRAYNELGNSGFAETRTSTAACEPTTIYVDVQATTGANHGGSWHDAYTNLQDALKTAVVGDQIWVARGTYTPGTLRTDPFVITTGVELYGGFSGTETAIDQRDWQANPTVLSGDLGKVGDSSDNSYHVITISGMGAASVIDGFTISGGNANKEYTADTGGGLWVTNAYLRLRHVLLTGNSADLGGGIASDHSQVLFEAVTFSDNQAREGGALYATNTSALTLTNVLFRDNQASKNGSIVPDGAGGGGMMSSSSRLTLEHVTFEGNKAYKIDGNGRASGGGLATFGGTMWMRDVTFSDNLGEDGGGMFNGSSNAIIQDVVFRDNVAKFGGGLLNRSDNLRMSNTRFIRNTADGGGGMQSTGSGSVVSNSVFTGNIANVGGGLYNSAADTHVSNTIFSGNSAQVGGAMYNVTASSPIISGVTFSANTATEAAGTIFDYAFSTITVRNSIFWGNTAPSGPQIVDDELTSGMIQYSLIQGGFSGMGNVAADPQFVRNPAPGPDERWGTADDDYGDLRLRAGSPAIDAGDNSAVFSDTADLDSDGDRNELIPIDLGGHDRRQDDSAVADTGYGIAPIVDMGAYEGGYSPPPPAPVSHLNIQITGSTEQVRPGESVTYRVAVTNAGPDPAQSVTVTTTLPEGITLLRSDALPYGDAGWTCAYTSSSRKYICTRADLAVGPAPEIRFIVTVTTTPGRYMITTEVDSATSPHEGGSGPVSAQIPLIVADGFNRIYLYMPFVRR
jgi:uncharacterized repeat protein (TIGR01451 family)